MSRLYLLRKLRSFNVCIKMLEMFYQSLVASGLFFTVVCWGSSIGASDTNRINKLIRRAGSVIGCKQDTVEAVVERRTLNKLFSIMDNPDQPLHHTLDRQRSSFSNRLLQLRCPRDRYRKSFLPQAIALYNSSHLSDRDSQLSAPPLRLSTSTLYLLLHYLHQCQYTLILFFKSNHLCISHVHSTVLDVYIFYCI